jgi:hypothetical protein
VGLKTHLQTPFLKNEPGMAVQPVISALEQEDGCPRSAGATQTLLQKQKKKKKLGVEEWLKLYSACLASLRP